MRQASIALMWCAAAAAAPKPHTLHDYLIDTPGATWHYDGPLGPAETVTITARDKDGTVHISNTDQNHQTATALWRLKDGAWTEDGFERSNPVVILPATLAVGSHWDITYTDGGGTKASHHLKIVSLDDKVTLKDGSSHTGLLRVDEVRPDLGADLPVVHYYEPGKGEIAEKIGESWYRSLASFEPGKK